MEASLRERERELEEAHHIARLGTWRWVKATDYLTWSPEVYRLYGCDPTQPPPRHDAVRQLMTPESHQQIVAALQRCFDTGEPYMLDLQIVTATGEPRWAQARGEVAERGPDGAVTVLRGTVQDITERKLAEQELARSEGRYRSLLRVSSDIIWTVDPQGAQLSDVPEWRAFTGQTFEELRGFGWADAIHPDDRDVTLAAWKRAIATGANFQTQQRLRRHDGVYRCMQVRAVSSRDAEGNIVEWVGMHTDITDQMEAAAAIRDSQARFQRLYDANMMAICYPDKFGAFFDGNDEFLRIVGYTREELNAGMVRWDTMTPPEYAELDATHIAEADRHGRCTPYEKEYIRKDGTRVPILCGYALLEGSDKNYIGFLIDLSVQKQAERALAERERRFRELTESLPQMAWEAGADTVITYVNRRWVDYTGLRVEDLSGTFARDLIHPDDLKQADEYRLHSLQTGEPYTGKVRMRRHDGVYRQFLARAVPVLNERNEVERWIGTLTDIHDQQLAEESLRRTEKLAATGRLAASIAHEINNPLSSVTNALYLALQMELSDAVRAYLLLAEQELARVAQVTTQTLRFHRQSTAPSECDLAEVLDSALALFLPRFHSAGIAVERDYRAHEKVYCYNDELRQVFVNLLGNALDATRKGGHVLLRVRSSPLLGGVRVTIADTGHGIPADLRVRVFEPFLSTKDDTGTGLGLWVSEGIVRKHGGRIALRSRTAEPSGTVFSVLIPYRGI